ncbi:Phosphotransferase enzyme family protein [Legionella santicrucis]|uniref:Phosphotransferase enzyme family protein n=1 Tax=Legionella santicrucis TaxID=45074 RepID=A0A0W0YIU2_9GAMM|nr:aminoglycoside phosphotransferase family protein [Legionella santicrucis]KTD56747.1 Phosphotransferase enzyme family protein [Legionella santicrucis]
MNDFISLYKQRLNLPNATFLRIEHEDALVAIVYKIICADYNIFILKICPRAQDYLREVFFLKQLSALLPVPRLIEEVPPEQGIAGAILMDYLPGNILKKADLTDKLAYEAGECLAKIHQNSVESYGDLTQPQDLSNRPEVHFAQKFEEGFSECCLNLPQDLLKKSRQYFDSHLALLDSVDGPCIIHRDFRPGNIIVLDGKLQGIIDWASARASFAEEDFCPLELGEWSNHPSIMRSFLAGYANVRSVPEYNDIMPLLRLSRCFATIGFTVKNNTWNSSNVQIYLNNRRFLEKFF